MSGAKGSYTRSQVRCRRRAVIDGGGQVVTLVPSRRKGHRSYSVTRRVQRVFRRFWARVFIGAGLTCNLGLHASWEAAARAAAEFARLRPSAEDYPRVLAELIARGLVPARVLPKWVYRRGDGRFGARRKTRAGVVDLPGPFDTPEAAFRAMLGRVRVAADGAGRVVALARVPRRRVYNPLRKYVRRKKNKFEPRFFMGGALNSITLGLHASPEAAARAAAEFVRALPSVDEYPRVIADLVARGLVPARVLPKWVYRRGDGRFGARRKTRAGVVYLPGPFDTPEAAFRAMLRRVSR